jgi:hypothetical protein
MPGYPGSDPALPDAEELFGPDRPARSPAELSAIMMHSIGLTDAPPRQPDPDGPDVSDLSRELGL